MEVLIKDSDDGVTFVALISGATEREIYIHHYCKHNNIKYLIDHNAVNNETGTFLNKLNDNIYAVFKLIDMHNADNIQAQRLEAMRIDIMRIELYTLRYIMRDEQSPFHRII